MDNAFLDGVDAKKAHWRDPDAHERGIHPAFRWTGRGRDGLEVVFGTSGSRPGAAAVREVWRRRHGRRAAPLLVVVAFPEARPRRAVVCGASGEDPPAVELDFGHAERLARAALAEPHRRLASRRIAEAMEDASDEHPGLRNKGLLATHELLHGVPKRDDWDEATRRAEHLLPKRGRDLVEGLGFEVEERGRHNVLRSSEGRARAVAVFLEDSEQAEQSSPRFENQTPVTYALSHAERDNIPWVVAERSGAVRLYSTSVSGAAGQRGRAETFVELNLPMLPSAKAGYLPLLFSAEALSEDGSLYEIRRDSGVYASELSRRLRERVYKEVVPRLAVAVAGQVGGTSEDDLGRHYRTALTILFRLMFVAYAEDSRLLPLNVNGEYTRHSLKTIARGLSDTINAGRALGFDDPLTSGRSAAEEPDGRDTAQTYFWDECKALFRAVDAGEGSWGVPAYNGGLFSSDSEVNPVGGEIEGLSLSNAEFGPALTALIVDRSEDGEGDDGIVGPIDFRSLSVREFGTIYEGLLESELSVADTPLTTNEKSAYIPAGEADEVVVGAGEVYLHNQSGVRKSSGSYFTKPFAVEHLIESSVKPTLKEHLGRVEDLLESGRHADAAAMLFDFRVADIAMGSGHFLTAVVDRLEAEYTTFLATNPIPEVRRELEGLRGAAVEALEKLDLADTVEIEDSSLLRRLIARRCVYGVDTNPLSVELARVGMWIHTFVPGLPLSFLDHNLAVGNSLTGIGTIEEATAELVRGVGEGSLFAEPVREELRRAEEPLRRLATITEATTDDIAEARQTAAEVEEAVAPVAGLFDRIVAARVGMASLPDGFSHEDLFETDTGCAGEVARRMDALHFPVAFPEVFLRERSGFDVIVGNPPWDKMHVETHEFWGRHFPGFRGLPQREKERCAVEYAAARPDLAADLEAEKETSEKVKASIAAGPYDLGVGHMDLAKVFAWRFWHLLREKGRFGVVLPRQAILSGPGMTSWRRMVLEEGAFDDVCLLTNNRKWIFDEVHPQYTVAMTTVLRDAEEPIVRLDGPYRSLADYEASRDRGSSELPAEEFAEWSADFSFPAFQTPEDTPVYRKLFVHPRFGDDRPDWEFRPVQGDVNATSDKAMFTFSDDSPPGMWPVYSGASFNLWNSETGDVYAWVEPKEMEGHLFEKRCRQSRHSRSAFSALSDEVIADRRTLPCLFPRIAFRDVARATDQRTAIAALVPPNITLQHAAPYLMRVSGSEEDEAYLLGVLSSRVFDWCARRQVELHLTFTVLNGLPIPAPPSDDPARRRVVEISGQLAAKDERYAGWAGAVGVPVGSVTGDEKSGLLAELDACVAHLFGLDEDDLRHVYATFHHGWDHELWTEAVIEHHRSLAPAGVEA